MACRVDAVPRGLPPGRSHRLLGPVESGAAGLRTGGGRLGRAPSPTRRSGPGRPIRASWPASPRAVSATLRHAARLLLHAAHGPLLPGAPICSSSSRPLLVALVVVVARRCRLTPSASPASPTIRRAFCLFLEVTQPWTRGREGRSSLSLRASSAFSFARFFGRV